MAKQSLGNRVQNELEHAVSLMRLPDAVQERAKQLLTRIKQPVRVGIMGMPETGKTTLLNFLVGESVFPVGVQLPTLELSYGELKQTICTMNDGTKTTLPHANMGEVLDMAPAFVQVQMPLPALRKITILEVVAPHDLAAMPRALEWATQRTDVVLWCSQFFDPQEQAFWEPMPDMIKDHGFLMFTKADILIAEGKLDDALEAARTVATDEFNKIMPISTKQAIASRRPNRTVDKDLMRSSGGTALITAVLKQVEQGRQSAVDMADILLHQNADILKGDLTATEDPPTPAKNTAAVVKPIPTEPETLKVGTPEPVEIIEEKNHSLLKADSRAAYEHVIGYMVNEGRTLTDFVAENAENIPSKIIAKSVEQVQWLSDYLNDNGDDSDDALQRIRETAMDAADLIQLMQMEKRDSAAIEALSLLVQLKHELQADLAA